jgi:thiamine biosynthesis protein ThiI
LLRETVDRGALPARRRLAGTDCVVVRYGELGTESPSVRRRMEERLRVNVAAALPARGLGGSVERQSGRLLARGTDPDDAADAAAELPGVVSASPAREVAPERDAICEAPVEVAREAARVEFQ